VVFSFFHEIDMQEGNFWVSVFYSSAGRWKIE